MKKTYKQPTIQILNVDSIASFLETSGFNSSLNDSGDFDGGNALSKEDNFWGDDEW